MRLDSKEIYLIAIFGSIVLSLLLEGVERIFRLEQYSQVFPDVENYWVDILTSVIIAPFIETLIFQMGLIFMFRLVFALLLDNQDTKSNSVLIPSVLLSSIIFGALHFYNAVYILLATLVGLFYGYIYYITLRKDKNPFFPVFVAHAVYNLFVMILDGKIFGV